MRAKDLAAKENPMRFRTALAVMLVAAAQVSSEPVFWFNSTVSVTDTNSAVLFTDNGSGGTGENFAARFILIRSGASSANTCYFDLKDTVATTSDTALEAGAGMEVNFQVGPEGGDGWSGMGAICAGGQTATFFVTATR